MYSREAYTQLTKIAEECHDTAVSKGWWKEDRSPAECIALIHSELSECLEAFRHGDPMDEHCPEHPNVAVELADAIIRILDMGIALDYDVPAALFAKMAYNKTRAHKHGGKVF